MSRNLIGLAMSCCACALAAPALGQSSEDTGCGVTFGPPASYDTGGAPAAIAFADFNRDGTRDMAIVGRLGSTVSILLGNPGGTFGPQAIYGVGDRPVAIAIADFNDDHNPDFVTANNTAGTITIRLGKGDGTFFGPLTTVVGTLPVGVVTGDFNTDGFADVAVAEKFDSRLSVFHGQGNGSFENPILVPCADPPASMTGADMDNDGQIDFVVATTNWSIVVFRRTGDGTIHPGQQVYLDNPVNFVDTADFNLDQKRDVVASTNAGPRVLLGNGGGGLVAPALTVALAGYPSIAGDFNNDAVPDVAVSLHSSPKAVRFYTGNGDGTFSQGPSVTIDGNSFALGADSLRQDGRTDLVACIESANYCTVFLNSGTPAPEIVQHPQPATSHGEPVTFTVEAVGDSLQYRWTRDDQLLTDGGHYSGATTASLTVSPVAPGDAGIYRAIVNEGCASRTSDGAALLYFCPADFDENTFTNGDDYDHFADLYWSGDIGADFNGDGEVTEEDLDLFVHFFGEGC